MLIRHEFQSDVDEIARITRAAFAHHPYSHQTEEFIVTALRVAQALTLSLVAELDGAVVGHAAFSPVTVSDGSRGWYGLGPISAVPERQRRGIGSALMRVGLTALSALGAKGCLLVGDPNYYTRFGFRPYPELAHEGVPPECFLVLPLARELPRGTGHFHPGFSATK